MNLSDFERMLNLLKKEGGQIVILYNDDDGQTLNVGWTMAIRWGKEAPDSDMYAGESIRTDSDFESACEHIMKEINGPR